MVQDEGFNIFEHLAALDILVAKGYPNWDIKPLIDNGLCAIPILAKYASYSLMSKNKKPSDEIVDELFDSIVKIFNGERFKDYKPDGEMCKGIKSKKREEDVFLPDVVCPIKRDISIAQETKDRLDKVVAIEAAISAQHDSGHIFELACSLEKKINTQGARNYDRFVSSLSTNLLDLLFEVK